MVTHYLLWEFYNLPQILPKYRRHGKNISVRQKELQKKNSEQFQLNILGFITRDTDLQKRILSEQKKRWIGIPIIKIRYKKTKMIWRLFGVIPLWIKLRKVE